MGPKLFHCSKLEQVGTKEYGKMLKRILILKDGRVHINTSPCLSTLLRWKQPKGEDRANMKKEEKLLRCTSLNGPAWRST